MEHMECLGILTNLVYTNMIIMLSGLVQSVMLFNMDQKLFLKISPTPGTVTSIVKIYMIKISWY